MRNDRTVNRPASRAGLTASELVVVLGLTLVVFAAGVPAVQQAREAARKQTCEANLSRLGEAIFAYEEAHQMLPNAWGSPGDGTGSIAYCGSWTKLLPYLDQTAVYEAYDWNKNWWDAENQAAINHRISLFECPDVPGEHQIKGLKKLGADDLDTSVTSATSDYKFFRGYIERRVPRVDGRVPGMLMGLTDDGATAQETNIAPKRAYTTDGVSYTVMVSERGGAPDFYIRGEKQANPNYNVYGWDESWASYNSAWPRFFDKDAQDGKFDGTCTINCQNSYGALYSFHKGGANFLFGDGAVKFLHEDISYEVLTALSSRAGGEVVSDTDF